MKRLLFTLTLLGCLCATVGAQLRSVSLAWDPNSEPDLAGYKLYYGTASGVYTHTNVLGLVTNTAVSGLSEGVTYYFAVTAFNTSGLESDFSNEVSYQVPFPEPDRVPGFQYLTLWQGRKPNILGLQWLSVTNVPLNEYRVYWGFINTNTQARLTTNLLRLPPDARSVTISNLLTYSNYWFTARAVSTTGREGGYTTEIRYSVPPLPPLGVRSFHQVITVMPQF
jgi:hypothetical protein